MKTFKKIMLGTCIIFSLLLTGGYIYFNQKFTPPPNHLTVSGNSQKIQLQWIKDGDNNYSALLLPVKLKNIDKTFYMQLDTGSPTTMFYQKSLECIQKKFFPTKNFKDLILSFNLNQMQISSPDFSVINYGNEVNFKDPEAISVIGTIGSDLLEKRIVILDFKDKICSFTDSLNEEGFSDFEFKKRKILISANIGNQKLKLMYDSGTSGYELVTHVESWNKYRIPKSKIKREKGNAWGNTLTIKTSAARQKIRLATSVLPLSEITYIERTSKIQNFLMKSSGMQGMLGNKLFRNSTLILDCNNEKFVEVI